MRAQKWWGAVALLPFLLIVGCSQPTSTPASSAAPAPKEAGVLGSITGIVIDSITKQPLAGVNVEISNGTGKIADTTDASGIYVLSGMVLGNYTVSFTKGGYQYTKIQNVTVNDTTGYTPITVTNPDGTTSTTDKDPFFEYSFALQELAAWLSAQNEASKAQAPFGGATTPLGNSWTYNPNNGYTLNNANGGTNNLTVTVNEDNTLKVNYTDKAFGKRVWYYSQEQTIAELAPLNGAFTGKIIVNFSKANNDASILATAPIQGGIKVWAIDTTGATLNTPVVDPPSYTGATPTAERFGPVVTDGAGNFVLDQLPSGKKMSLWVEPFSQTLTSVTPAITYYIAGAAAGSDPEKSGSSYLGDFTTQHKVTLNVGQNLKVYSFDDKAIVLEHNIGVINNATPLSVDATVQPGLTTAIVLKFNKAIEIDSFKDSFVDTDGTGTFNAATDYYLDDTWSTDSLTVTLKPRAYLNNAKGSQLPYSLAGGNATLVIPASAHSVDGYTLQYAGYTGAVGTTLGDKRLKIYTEDAIKVTNVRFLDSTGTTPIEYQNTFDPTSVVNWKLPLDGVVEITFDKPLAAAANQKVYLYSWTDTIANGKLDASEQPTVSTLQDLVAKANTPTVTGSVLTFSFSKLSTNKRYAVGLYALSTRPFDSPATNQYVGFQASDGVKLISTNLYKDQSTLYYKDKPSASANYFTTSSDLILTFDRAFPAGTTAKVELYKAADVTALWNNPSALTYKIIPTAAPTVGASSITINPTTNLDPNVQYAVVVQLLRADGTELFYTKSKEFYDAYSVGGALVNEIVASSNPDVSGGSSSYYILFTTEALFAAVQKYNPAAAVSDVNLKASVTNIDTTAVYANRTTDFKGDAAVKVQFNKTLATPVAGDVVLYYWNDANANQTVESGEITDTGATAAVSGAVLTVTPTNTLAAGKKFVLKAKLVNAAEPNDQVVFDGSAAAVSFYGVAANKPNQAFARQNYLVFQTDTKLILLTGAALTANKITSLKAVDTITGITGVDSSSATVSLSFDAKMKFLDGSAGYYTVYHKRPGLDADWTAINDGSTTEAFAADTLVNYLNSTRTVAVDIPNLIVADNLSGLLGGKTIDYLVTAWDTTGAALQSDIVTVSDTVKPLASFTSNLPTVAGAAIPVFQADGVTPAAAPLTISGAGPYVHTNGTAASVPVYIDLAFTNANSEVIKNIVVTPSFANANVTAAFYNPASSTSGGFVRITIPGGASISTGDKVTVDFDDTSGNGCVILRATANPTESVLSSNTIQ